MKEWLQKSLLRMHEQRRGNALTAFPTFCTQDMSAWLKEIVKRRKGSTEMGIIGACCSI